MYKRLMVVFTFTAILLLTYGCGIRHAESRQHAKFTQPRSQTDIYYFQVSRGESTLRLNINLETEDGELSWVLTDPLGENKLDGKLEGKDSYKKVQLFEPVEGKWKFEVYTEKAIGQIDVRWITH